MALNEAAGCLRARVRVFSLKSGMFKKAVQRGRSERKVESYPSPVHRDLERNENEAGGLFQYPLLPKWRNWQTH